MTSSWSEEWRPKGVQDVVKFKESTVLGKRYSFVRCRTCGRVFNICGGAFSETSAIYYCNDYRCEGFLKGEKNLESIGKEEAYERLVGIYEGNPTAMRQVDREFGVNEEAKVGDGKD